MLEEPQFQARDYWRDVEGTVHPGPAGLALSRWSERYRHQREPAYLISKREQLELPGLRTTELEAPEI